MVRINFNLRHHRSGEQSPINIVIRWNGERLIYPSKERIDPRHWSTTTQGAKRTHSGNADFNISLTNITGDIEKTFRSLTEKHERTPSVQELRDSLDKVLNRKKEDTAPNLFEFIARFIEQSKTRVNPEKGERLAKTSLKNYNTAFAQLKGYAKARRKVIDFANVDLLFYDQFTAYLTTDRGLAMNTVGKYIQTIKTFLRAADESGIAVNQSYRSRRFRAAKEQTDKIYLNESELNELFHLDLTANKRLEMVRDLFIVGAWTGLRFGDFSSIKPEEITGDQFRIRTNKTGATVVIPFHPCVRAILNKYEGKYPNSLPPAISNQKMNDYLKEVTAMVESLQSLFVVSITIAGVRKSVTKRKCEFITTHTARRSFATNMYLAKCPTRTIMAITGHKSESAFRAYIRLDSDEHADIIQMYMNPSSVLTAIK